VANGGDGAAGRGAPADDEPGAVSYVRRVGQQRRVALALVLEHAHAMAMRIQRLHRTRFAKVRRRVAHGRERGISRRLPPSVKPQQI
jgi:hypothetical protein